MKESFESFIGVGISALVLAALIVGALATTVTDKTTGSEGYQSEIESTEITDYEGVTSE